MLIPVINFQAMSLFLVYCILLIACDSASKANTQAKRFKCSIGCGTSVKATLLSPVVRPVRSRLECSSRCSKLLWCLRYIYVKNGSSNMTKSAAHPHDCLMFLTDDPECPPGLPIYGSDFSSCAKGAEALTAGTDTCKMLRQLLLDRGAYLVDHVFMLQLFLVGNEMKLRYGAGNSSYVAKGKTYLLPSTSTQPMLAQVPEFVISVNAGRVMLTLRSFYTNLTYGTAATYNSISSYSISDAIGLQWIVQRRARGLLGYKEKIFTTGGDASALAAAVAGGNRINLLMVGSPSRMLSADVLLADESSVRAQAIYHEDKKFKAVTVSSSGSPNLVTWDYVNLLRLETGPITSDYVWYAESCWTSILTTSSQYQTSTLSAFQTLKTAVLQGFRLRVGFTVSAQTVYATPSYIGINNTDTITAHVVNVMRRESLLNLGLQYTTTKVNYILSSDGFAQEFAIDFGSDAVKVTETTTSVQWFVDRQNFTMVHSTVPKAPPDPTTLARLVERVNNGSDVRIKVFLDSNEYHFFTCDALQVLNDGSQVKCQVTDQLAVDFLGNTTQVTQSTSNGFLLGGLLTGGSTTYTTSYSPTVTSGCPQFLTISTSGSMASAIGCLEAVAVLKNSSDQWVYVDWFATV